MTYLDTSALLKRFVARERTSHSPRPTPAYSPLRVLSVFAR